MFQLELDLNKGPLAARLGTVPETLARLFYRLSRDGIVEVEGAKITLCDRAALQNLME